MYRSRKIATLIGDFATVAIFEITNMKTSTVRYKLQHEELADAENPKGVRIMDDRVYALKLAAGLAQEGRIG